MSESNPSLPLHPSLEQLRKQAKELLQKLQSGDAEALKRLHSHKPQSSDPRLADAQFILAREFGFQSWPKLVQYVETVAPSDRISRFSSLARDMIEAHGGDLNALQRINSRFPRSLTLEQLRELVAQRLSALQDPQPNAEFTLPDAQLIIARQFGFKNWEKFTESLVKPAVDPRSVVHGMSLTPPFYQIDWKNNTIAPGPLTSKEDWDAIFDVMDELQITGIEAQGQLTDRALERLSRLKHVTHLNFDGTRHVTDKGLQHLANMPQLRELNLSEYPGGTITNKGLEVLKFLPELRKFEMCWQGAITDQGITNLKFCDQLESVNLLGSNTGDGALKALKGMTQLRKLKTGRLVTDRGIPLLQSFPIFKSRQEWKSKYDLMAFECDPVHLLIDGPFTRVGLESLQSLEGLMGLSFFWHTSELRGDDLGMLAGIPNLIFLGCQGELCDDVAMGHIAEIPGLRMVMGQGTVASDDGFVSLSRSQTIEYIWGRECPNLQGRGFAALSAMPSLRGIAVSCKNVDDTALSMLPQFPALTELMPMDVADEGFRHVGRCEQLEVLVMMYCRDTTDIATKHIAGLSRLKRYYAGSTKITDQSLEILARMRSLESLTFESCSGITDAGVAFLAQLPGLREISIGASPSVTREGMKVFADHIRVTYW